MAAHITAAQASSALGDTQSAEEHIQAVANGITRSTRRDATRTSNCGVFDSPVERVRNIFTIFIRPEAQVEASS